jgi:hypothetical protein
MPFYDEDSIDIVQVGDTEFTLAKFVRYKGRDQEFLVPAGQSTDLASVPLVLTWLLPRYGKWTKPAILHDYLWRSGVVPKRDADGIFRCALRESGVPLHQRWTMWSAVRLSSIFTHGGAKGTPIKDWSLLLFLWTSLIIFLVVPVTVVVVFKLVYNVVGKLLDFFDRSS